MKVRSRVKQKLNDAFLVMVRDENAKPVKLYDSHFYFVAQVVKFFYSLITYENVYILRFKRK